MDVILLERVEKLGRIGDIVTVKTGYARNFLLPRGKALRATEANRKRFEAQRSHLEAENAKRREVAEVEAKAIDGITFVLIRQASNAGALYGSVSARDLAEALGEAGHKVAKSAIVLDRPIKTLGLHGVKVALHPEVSVMVTANVARSPEEADLQAKGVDVTAFADADEPAAEALPEEAPADAAADAAAGEA
jgi:large subunit ribosomal protein L9